MGRVFVKDGSGYTHLNNQEFPIIEAVGSRVSLNIDGQTTDFFNCEVSVKVLDGKWMAFGVAAKWNLLTSVEL